MTEPNRRIVVDGIEFSQLVEFPKILTAAVSSFNPARLLVALFMVAAIVTGGRIWDGVATPSVTPGRSGLAETPMSDGDRGAARSVLVSTVNDLGVDVDWEVQDADALLNDGSAIRSLLDDGFSSTEEADADRFARAAARIERVRPRGLFEACLDRVTSGFTTMIRGVFAMSPLEVGRGCGSIVSVPGDAWRHDRPFAIVFGLYLVVVFAVGGGALCRMSACHTSGGERLSVGRAFDFAFSHWPRLIGAPLLPLIIAGVLILILAVGGYVMTLPFIDLLGGLLYGLALLVGFGVAFLVIGYIAGFVMLLPAAACEDADAADAQQRAYAYALSRPLRLAGYLIVALVGLALGYLVAALFASTLLNMTAAIGGMFSDSPAFAVAGGFEVFDLSGREMPFLAVAHERGAAAAISFWQTVVVCLVGAYVFAYLFSAATWVYLLMRQACDGQSIHEIWRETPRSAGAPAPVEDPLV